MTLIGSRYLYLSLGKGLRTSCRERCTVRASIRHGVRRVDAAQEVLVLVWILCLHRSEHKLRCSGNLGAVDGYHSSVYELFQVGMLVG